jgi:hypothetical protein
MLFLAAAALLACPPGARAQDDAQPRDPSAERPRNALPPEGEPRRPVRDGLRERFRDGEQPQNRPGDRPSDRPGDRDRGWLGRIEAQPAVLRERLSRRLEDIRRQETLLGGAIARLDEGASPREVVRDLLRGGVGAEGLGEPAPPGAPELSEEELRAFVKREMPMLDERLEQLAQSPEAERGPIARRILSQLRPRLEELYQLEKTDRDLYELKKREMLAGVLTIDATRRIAQSFQQWDEATRQSAKRRLRASIEASFDARHEVLAREIRDLESRLAGMKADLDAQNQRRDQLIDERTDFLFDQARKGVGEHPGEQRPPAREGPR